MFFGMFWGTIVDIMLLFPSLNSYIPYFKGANMCRQCADVDLVAAMDCSTQYDMDCSLAYAANSTVYCLSRLTKHPNGLYWFVLVGSKILCSKQNVHKSIQHLSDHQYCFKGLILLLWRKSVNLAAEFFYFLNCQFFTLFGSQNYNITLM